MSVSEFPSSCIELRLESIAHLFDPFDPFPLPSRDLAKSAEEFIVGWARELPHDTPIEMVTIEPRLLDLLHVLRQRVGSQAPFRVISGYRSPATNAMLAEASSGVASHSLHMQGMAIDISLADVDLADLRRGALDLRSGGVGYYPASGFVHVDVGRVRQW